MFYEINYEINYVLCELILSTAIWNGTNLPCAEKPYCTILMSIQF